MCTWKLKIIVVKTYMMNSSNCHVEERGKRSIVQEDKKNMSCTTSFSRREISVMKYHIFVNTICTFLASSMRNIWFIQNSRLLVDTNTKRWSLMIEEFAKLIIRMHSFFKTSFHEQKECFPNKVEIKLGLLHSNSFPLFCNMNRDNF